MSETSTETAPAPSGGSSNVFMRKMGPLPVWAWMGIGLALALTYYFWKQNKAKASASTSATTGTTSGTTGTTDSSLVPQFVNQTYVENNPPPAPPVPPTPPPDKDQPEPMKPAPNAQANQYPAPGSISVKKLTGTSAQVNWGYVTSVTPTPQSYTVAVYKTNGQLAQQQTVNPDTKTSSGTYTINGLQAGQKYNVVVWANGGKVAPPGAKAPLTMLWPGHMSK